jgi:hypothetical protein
MNPNDPNDLNNYRIQEMTSDDLESMKPFIGALRTHAATLTEEADAKLPKGAQAYPLSQESIERDIRTKPELRDRWNRLTPAQQTYAYNRYVQNIPARYESRAAGVVDPYMSALEHDYQRVHNPIRYKIGRTLFRGLTRMVGGNPTGEQENYAKGLLGKSFVGTGVGLLYGGRDAVHMAREANLGLQTGGYQYGKNPLAKQPTTKAMAAAEEGAELFFPAALDSLAFGAALKGASAAPKLAPFAKSKFAQMAANYRNPIGESKFLFSPLFNATSKTGKFVDYGLRGLMGYGIANTVYDAGKGVYTAAQDNNTPMVVFDPYGYGPTVAQVRLKQQQAASGQSPAQSNTVAPTTQQQATTATQGVQPSSNQAPNRREGLRRIADAMFGGAAGGSWLGGALGGGLLGLLFGGKNRFLSGILGALLGVGGLAAYNYYKGRPR